MSHDDIESSTFEIERQQTHRYRVKLSVWCFAECNRSWSLWRAEVVAASDPRFDHLVHQKSPILESPGGAIADLLHLIYRDLNPEDVGMLVTEVEFGQVSAEVYHAQVSQNAQERAINCGLSSVERKTR